MLALLLVPLADAYELQGWAWPADVPVELHWTGAVDGFTHDELQTVLEDSAAAWTRSAPCTFSFSVVEDPDAEAYSHAGGVGVLFGDPDDVLATGVYALTYGFWDGSSAPFDTLPTSMQLIVADQVPWTSDAAIDSGECSDQVSLQSVLTHELGIVAGLAPQSCSDGSCTPEELESTMASSNPVCDDHASTPNADDQAGLQAIYGTAGIFGLTCTAEPEDPLTVTCSASPDPSAMGPTWDFGDGTLVDGGASATHTYAAPGEFVIGLCAETAECDRQSCSSETIEVMNSPYDSFEPDTSEDEPEKTGGCSAVSTPGSFTGAMFALAALTLRSRPARRGSQRRDDCGPGGSPGRARRPKEALRPPDASTPPR